MTGVRATKLGECRQMVVPGRTLDPLGLVFDTAATGAVGLGEALRWVARRQADRPR